VVTDHGEGIPAEEQELIFEKFVRGARAKRQRATGAGLGLATCRALAELLGGHIGLDSEPGRGASFFLTLRLKRNLEPVTASSPDLPQLALRQRALVVEDQAYNQMIVRRIAENLGFSTDVAGTAREALAQLENQEYAVMFLDWELPDTTGEELARQIRASPRGRDTILLATTAHESEDIRLRALAVGFDDFALKPLSGAAIARVLEAVRRRRASGGGKGQAALDTRVFRLIGRNRRQGVRQAANDYGETLEREMQALATALSEDDRRGIARVAHRLKTHAGLVQAVELRASVDRLERGASAMSPTALAELVSEISVQADALRNQLTQLHPPGAAV
jgi:CheY-like chemotaxis protein